MISEVVILSKSGVVYWRKSGSNDENYQTFNEGINSLISKVLVKVREGTVKSFDYESFRFDWISDNHSNLLIVSAAPKNTPLVNIKMFLSSVGDSFREWRGSRSVTDVVECSNVEFTPVFDTLWAKYEQLFLKKDSNLFSTGAGQTQKDTGKKPSSKKKFRTWDNSAGHNEELAQTLDYSGTQESSQAVSTDEIPSSWLEQRPGKDGIVDAGEFEGTGTSIVKNNDSYLKQINRWFGDISLGKRVLSDDELNPIIDKMREHLISKNVAAETARNLAAAAKAALLGTEISGMTTVRSSVKASMEEALSKVLNTSSGIDLMRDINEKNSSGKLFSIVFCGVNGVGKSTNLSKVCFWLLKNKKRVLIAACDTFRSGAVEQLKTHVRKLNALFPSPSDQMAVGLYEQGYGKDAPIIAKNAMAFAEKNKYDVILIDTAGRMQDNEPLMRSLAKLITINSPDRIFFVGEALVGNEAIDQLTKFNKALQDFSTLSASQARVIDGIILTKFDTIDDKVGAAVSMSYVTGKPIVFVGVGQTYVDLKRLNIQMILESLLK